MVKLKFQRNDYKSESFKYVTGGNILQSVKLLLDQYGYIALFLSLLLELIALPLPGETLMSYCGYLVYRGKLSWSISILTSSLGAIIGITISYIIGKTLGANFFNKYGSYVHMKPEKLKKVSSWFETYGSKLLIFSYFIPGVRHITGYFAGITKISFKKFAINAYIGGFLWSFTFITLGKALGSGWHRFHAYIRRYVILIAIVLVIIILIMFIYKYYKKNS
ncbi:putative membrane-associated protein [Clostridium pasteurianum BC1]|uniref:Putative membrane-associated protein n=1 Tax=Clostridium pasteurianum BC1 TaxID=86416 RepID=R4K696_CLOPA|nr:putative membrane-associated protein [Clostridium pasteurianum BC1]